MSVQNQVIKIQFSRFQGKLDLEGEVLEQHRERMEDIGIGIFVKSPGEFTPNTASP